MKIAYLILAYNNFKHLQRLIDALTSENASFYIHIDKRAKAPELKGKIKYAKRINSYWSTFNCVSPTIEMMKEACKDGNEYFVLLSGQDYPIVSNEEIEKRLKEYGEIIYLQKHTSTIASPLSHHKYYYLITERMKDSFRLRLVRKIENVIRRIRIKKDIPFEIYHGSTWFAITRKCTEYVLNEIENNGEYIRFFKHSRFPEEHFFATIIGNSKFKENIKHDLTWTDWSGIHHPSIIKEKHIDYFKGSFYLFARKFTDESTEVINVIDRELRGEFVAEKR